EVMTEKTFQGMHANGKETILSCLEGWEGKIANCYGCAAGNGSATVRYALEVNAFPFRVATSMRRKAWRSDEDADDENGENNFRPPSDKEIEKTDNFDD
ncbi:hypothetical protein Tco_1393957, partial [Tanacetum coccineum]